MERRHILRLAAEAEAALSAGHTPRLSPRNDCDWGCVACGGSQQAVAEILRKRGHTLWPTVTPGGGWSVVVDPDGPAMRRSAHHLIECGAPWSFSYIPAWCWPPGTDIAAILTAATQARSRVGYPVLADRIEAVVMSMALARKSV